jgi:hypothetical protein
LFAKRNIVEIYIRTFPPLPKLNVGATLLKPDRGGIYPRFTGKMWRMMIRVFFFRSQEPVTNFYIVNFMLMTLPIAMLTVHSQCTLSFSYTV